MKQFAKLLSFTSYYIQSPVKDRQPQIYNLCSLSLNMFPKFVKALERSYFIRSFYRSLITLPLTHLGAVLGGVFILYDFQQRPLATIQWCVVIKMHQYQHDSNLYSNLSFFFVQIYSSRCVYVFIMCLTSYKLQRTYNDSSIESSIYIFATQSIILGILFYAICTFSIAEANNWHVDLECGIDGIRFIICLPQFFNNH